MLKKAPRAYTRRIAPGLYIARSHSRPRTHRHYVGVDGHGVATCSCEAYEYQPLRGCWAMRAVARRLLRNRKEREEVAAR